MSAKRVFSFVLCLVLIAGFGALQASAADKPKDFPNRPITIMVGFGAGGSSDVGVRILGEALEEGHRTDRPGGKQARRRRPGDVDRLQEQRQAGRLHPGAYQCASTPDHRLRPHPEAGVHHEGFPAGGESRSGPRRHLRSDGEPVQDPGGSAERRQGAAEADQGLDHRDRQRRPLVGAGRGAQGGGTVQHRASGGHAHGAAPGSGWTHRRELRQRRGFPARDEVGPGADAGGL